MHEEKGTSLTNGAGKKNQISTHKRIKLDLSLSSCTNINAKWSKGLNVGSETLKVFQGNREDTQRHGHSQRFPEKFLC